MSEPTPPPPPVGPRVAFPEFVAMIAAMMALTALSIDLMLPALPLIGETFALAEPNHQQLVVIVYLLGFAGGQPIHGPLSDRLGRKPVLFIGFSIYLVGSIAAIIAPSFAWLLAARLVQGLGAASPRVVAIAIVRDRFAGRNMSRVMSFVMMVFIMVPVIAPSIGSGLLHLGPWPWQFGFLLMTVAALMVWVALRLSETRPTMAAVPLGEAIRTVVTTPQTVGYTLALGFLFGNLMTYVSTAEQIFTRIYGLGQAFTLVFGAVAGFLVLASFSNARLVERVGMRRISHAALIAYLVLCLGFAAAGFPAEPPLWLYVAFLSGTFFCFGHIMPNFNAIAMEPLGRVAGVGSSFVGFYMTGAGAVLGGLIGHAYDGTVRPLTVGFTVLSALSILVVLATERGRLFRTGAPPPRR